MRFYFWSNSLSSSRSPFSCRTSMFVIGVPLNRLSGTNGVEVVEVLFVALRPSSSWSIWLAASRSISLSISWLIRLWFTSILCLLIRHIVVSLWFVTLKLLLLLLICAVVSLGLFWSSSSFVLVIISVEFEPVDELAKLTLRVIPSRVLTWRLGCLDWAIWAKWSQWFLLSMTPSRSGTSLTERWANAWKKTQNLNKYKLTNKIQRLYLIDWHTNRIDKSNLHHRQLVLLLTIHYILEQKTKPKNYFKYILKENIKLNSRLALCLVRASQCRPVRKTRSSPDPQRVSRSPRVSWWRIDRKRSYSSHGVGHEVLRRTSRRFCRIWWSVRMGRVYCNDRE